MGWGQGAISDMLSDFQGGYFLLHPGKKAASPPLIQKFIQIHFQIYINAFLNKFFEVRSTSYNFFLFLVL